MQKKGFRIRKVTFDSGAHHVPSPQKELRHVVEQRSPGKAYFGLRGVLFGVFTLLVSIKESESKISLVDLF